MGQEWTVFQFVALSGFVMGCPRNIVNGQGLKVSTAKHSSEKGEGGSLFSLAWKWRKCHKTC